MSLPRTAPTVERVCEWCHHQFTVLARRARRPRRGVMCSKSCASAYGGARQNAVHPQAGAGNSNWKGGVSADHYRYTKRFRAKSPAKHEAQQIVAAAIRTGRMVRPDACSACHVACEPHGHHDDYTQPLVVRWLCRPCHLRHHATERAARRAVAA